MKIKLILTALLTLLTLVAGSGLLYKVMDSTEYSPSYSEQAFTAVREGMTEEDVRGLLGQPLRLHDGLPGVVRWYGPPGSWVGEDGGLHCTGPDSSNAAIVHFDLTGNTARWGRWAGKSPEEVSVGLGKPIKEKVQTATVYWEYTRSDGDYHRRWLGFDQSGKVVEKVAFFWRD